MAGSISVFLCQLALYAIGSGNEVVLPSPLTGLHLAGNVVHRAVGTWGTRQCDSAPDLATIAGFASYMCPLVGSAMTRRHRAYYLGFGLSEGE